MKEPLEPFEDYVMQLLASGLNHKEIAAKTGYAPASTKSIQHWFAKIRHHYGAPTTMAAMHLWTKEKARQDLLGSALRKKLIDLANGITDDCE